MPCCGDAGGQAVVAVVAVGLDVAFAAEGAGGAGAGDGLADEAMPGVALGQVCGGHGCWAAVLRKAGAGQGPVILQPIRYWCETGWAGV